MGPIWLFDFNRRDPRGVGIDCSSITGGPTRNNLGLSRGGTDKDDGDKN